MSEPGAAAPWATPLLPDHHDPWARFGWLIQSVWLVFLVFPILAIAAEPRASWQVVLGLLLVAGFGAAYALGVRHLDRLEKACRPRHRFGALYLGLLLAFAAATVPLIGAGALSFLPFVVAFSMFALPVAWALALGAACVLGSVAVAVLVVPDEGTWVVVFIVLAVAVMTAGIRLLGERGRQYDEMSRELALVAERERVARDVHDVLGHSLTVVTVKAELAERLVDLDPERAKAELVEIQALSRQALAEIRATVGGLRAARLGDELASARSALAGAGVQGHVPGDPTTVDPRHRTVLAWVLREAITNVVRHSDADECWVELDTNRLTVRNAAAASTGGPVG